MFRELIFKVELVFFIGLVLYDSVIVWEVDCVLGFFNYFRKVIVLID